MHNHGLGRPEAMISGFRQRQSLHRLNSDASLVSFIDTYAVADIANTLLIRLRVLRPQASSLDGYVFFGINLELHSIAEVWEGAVCGK